MNKILNAFWLQNWQFSVASSKSIFYCCDTSDMAICVTLRRLLAMSRLSRVQSCLCTRSVQLPTRTLCLTNHNSPINCSAGTMKAQKAVSILCSKQQNMCALLKSEALWQKTSWQCGFHTTPQRNLPPMLWMFIKPLAKFASMLTGRWVHVAFTALIFYELNSQISIINC